MNEQITAPIDQTRRLISESSAGTPDSDSGAILTQLSTIGRRHELIEELLQRQADEPEAAMEALWREIYDEVHRMARVVLSREGSRRPIQTTVLVHELYLKLGGANFENRAHFFGSLVRMMGQIVIDAARRRQRQQRREADWATGTASALVLQTEALGLAVDPRGEASGTIIAALDQLDVQAPRAASVAWLRFIGGLSVAQVACCLDVSERTVKGDWAIARAWLHRELTARGLSPRSERPGRAND